MAACNEGIIIAAAFRLETLAPSRGDAPEVDNLDGLKCDC